MKNLWIVTRMELTLFLRGKVVWFILLFVVVWSLLLQIILHSNLLAGWTNFSAYAHLLMLILAFTTGNQIQRDRDQRLSDVVWSTPISTMVYVVGKYLAAILLLFGFAVTYLLSLIVLDMLIPASPYPALGWQPYLLSWIWLIPSSLVFGAALQLWTMLITKGQRIVCSIILLLVWITPLFSIPSFLNLMGNPQGSDSALAHILSNYQDFGRNFQPSATLVEQITHLFQADMPGAYVTTNFLLSRLIFLGLGIVLLFLTIDGLRRQRQTRV